MSLFEREAMEVVGLEVEDDLLFAELSRQLSLLLMDDNDFPVPHTPVSLQAFSHGVVRAPPPLLYEHAHASAPCKGTGVFIPRSLLPPKKQRRVRYNTKPSRQLPVLIDVNSGAVSDHSRRPAKG